MRKAKKPGDMIDRAYEEIARNLKRVNLPISKTAPEQPDKRYIPLFKSSPVTKKSEEAQKLRDFVTICVKTTGERPSRDRIIELAAVRFVDFEPIEYVQTLINSGVSIPPKSVEATGITDKKTVFAPTISSIAQSVIDFIGDEKIILTHDITFSLGFLYANRINLTKPQKKLIDIASVAKTTLSAYNHRTKQTFKVIENYELKTLIRFYNLWEPETSGAFSDCLAIGQIFKKLLYDRITYGSVYGRDYSKELSVRETALKIKIPIYRRRWTVAACVAAAIGVCGGIYKGYKESRLEDTDVFYDASPPAVIDDEEESAAFTPLEAPRNVFVDEEQSILIWSETRYATKYNVYDFGLYIGEAKGSGYDIADIAEPGGHMLQVAAVDKDGTAGDKSERAYHFVAGNSPSVRNGEGHALAVVSAPSMLRYTWGVIATGAAAGTVSHYLNAEGSVNNDAAGSRAAAYNALLSVNGGETVSVTADAPKEQVFTVMEFSGAPIDQNAMTPGGLVADAWREEPLVLRAETKFIWIGFRKGDGEGDIYTPEELKALSAYLSVTPAAS